MEAYLKNLLLLHMMLDDVSVSMINFFDMAFEVITQDGGFNVKEAAVAAFMTRQAVSKKISWLIEEGYIDRQVKSKWHIKDLSSLIIEKGSPDIVNLYESMGGVA